MANVRNLPMALLTSPERPERTAHATDPATGATYIITLSDEGADLTLLATSRRLGRVTIPAGTYLRDAGRDRGHLPRDHPDQQLAARLAPQRRAPVAPAIHRHPHPRSQPVASP